jgi:hypothetical protein
MICGIFGEWEWPIYKNLSSNIRWDKFKLYFFVHHYRGFGATMQASSMMKDLRRLIRLPARACKGSTMYGFKAGELAKLRSRRYSKIAFTMKSCRNFEVCSPLQLLLIIRSLYNLFAITMVTHFNFAFGVQQSGFDMICRRKDNIETSKYVCLFVCLYMIAY